MKLILAAASISFTVVTSSASSLYDNTGSFAGVYLCVPDLSTGFWRDPQTNKWETAKFDVNGRHTVFTIKSVGPTVIESFGGRHDAHYYSVSVSKAGSNRMHPCVSDDTGTFDEIAFSSGGAFACDAVLTSYRMNIRSMRYMTTYTIGYIDGSYSSTDTPSMSIGKCTKIQ